MENEFDWNSILLIPFLTFKIVLFPPSFHAWNSFLIVLYQTAGSNLVKMWYNVWRIHIHKRRRLLHTFMHKIEKMPANIHILHSNCKKQRKGTKDICPRSCHPIKISLDGYRIGKSEGKRRRMTKLKWKRRNRWEIDGRKTNDFASSKTHSNCKSQ